MPTVVRGVTKRRLAATEEIESGEVNNHDLLWVNGSTS
jgi:hypothetical protein